MKNPFKAPPPNWPAPSRFRLRTIVILILIYACFKTFGIGHLPPFPTQNPEAAAIQARPIPIPPDSSGTARFHVIDFGGRPARHAGSLIELGNAAATPLQSVIAWLFGANRVILPSCLTEQPPAPLQAAAAPRLPIRDDLPGFYGAPWTARYAGNLVALLRVYAPRDAVQPQPGATLQVYRHYTGQLDVPDFAAAAPVRVYRGSAAVLYRVFANGPVRCIDLVVPNDQPQGTGHLYYEKYQRYYEATANFIIQK